MNNLNCYKCSSVIIYCDVGTYNTKSGVLILSSYYYYNRVYAFIWQIRFFSIYHGVLYVLYHRVLKNYISNFNRNVSENIIINYYKVKNTYYIYL